MQWPSSRNRGQTFEVNWFKNVFSSFLLQFFISVEFFDVFSTMKNAGDVFSCHVCNSEMPECEKRVDCCLTPDDAHIQGFFLFKLNFTSIVQFEVEKTGLFHCLFLLIISACPSMPHFACFKTQTYDGTCKCCEKCTQMYPMGRSQLNSIIHRDILDVFSTGILETIFWNVFF